MANKKSPKTCCAAGAQNENRRNFQDEERARAWADLSDPYGDPYRQSIINPIIYGLIEDLAIMEQPDNKFEDYSDDDSPLCDTLARYYGIVCKNGKVQDEETKELRWDVNTDSLNYRQWFERDPHGRIRGDERFHVLDLGCGEGYRGRWLGRKRISYTGVDYSKTLLEIARERLEKAKLPKDASVRFEEMDLRSEPERVSNELIEPTTRLVLAITILDHLNDADAVRLLQALCAEAGALKRCYMLVATCNPDYYKTLDYDDDEPIDGHCRRAIGKLESLLDNEVCEVEFIPRSTAQYRRIFRDAGLLVIDQVTPVAPITLRPDSDELYEKGTGPFHFWLLSLHGRSFSKASLGSEVFNSIDHSSIAGKVIAKLRQHEVQEVSTMTVAAGRSIVGMSNAGGNLYILLRGEAFLRAHSEKIPKMPFREGAVFGDLELSDLAGPASDNQHRTTSYRQSVVAAKECELAVITESDVQPLVTDSSIEGALHKLLRIRLQSQVWLMDAKSATFGMHGDRVLPDGRGKLRILPYVTIAKSDNSKIHEVHIQACHFVAACLVAALERQRSVFPNLGIGNDVIFIPQIKSNVQSVSKIDQVVEAIRILVSAGVIYSAPLPVTRSFWEEAASLPASDPLRKIALSGPISKRYRQYVSPDLGSENLVAFFLIEDEWALRKIAARPGHGTTRLIDSLLFLNSAYNSAETGLKRIPALGAYGDSSKWNLMKLSPVYRARFQRFKGCVQAYLRGAIKENIAEDSLGFSLE
jgi:SAM-dependent methyltransferase